MCSRPLTLFALMAMPDLGISQARDYGFRLEGYSTATQVVVTGSLFGWEPSGMPLQRHDSGVFATTTTLPPGKHLYKFIVNGTDWLPDPANPRREDDSHGGYNSVVVIGSEDPVAAARAARPNYLWGETTWTLSGAPTEGEDWLPVRLEGEKPIYSPEPPAAGKGRLLLTRSVVPVPESIHASDQRTSYPLRARRILVWLPPGYDQKTSSRFPVIYMHDGQNVFDDQRCCFGNGGWEVNTALEELGERYATIIVGIPNSPERLLDLGLGPNAASAVPTDYTQYIVKSIKPLIDQSFRTRPEREHTSIGGSSMGGIASIYAAVTFPETFGRVAALSPAFFYRDDTGTSLGKVLQRRGRYPARVYVDSGDSGVWNDGVNATRDYVRIAQAAGFITGKDFLHVEEAGAEHNEKAWRRRTPSWLRWLLDPRGSVPAVHGGEDGEGPAGG
jgi:predicted alpha/beta superfamily hydrolase